MEVTLPSTTRERGEPAVCPTDDDTIAPRRAGDSKKVDKRSLDYILRSGLAGGMAGCAVCVPHRKKLPSTGGSRGY